MLKHHWNGMNQVYKQKTMSVYIQYYQRSSLITTTNFQNGKLLVYNRFRLFGEHYFFRIVHYTRFTIIATHRNRNKSKWFFPKVDIMWNRSTSNQRQRSISTIHKVTLANSIFNTCTIQANFTSFWKKFSTEKVHNIQKPYIWTTNNQLMALTSMQNTQQFFLHMDLPILLRDKGQCC